MFNWFWDFLYLITKSIYRLIDGLIECCFMLCGITEVRIGGKNTNLITWLLDVEEVKLGFKVAALVGIVLVTFFSIWQILKTIISEKPEMTPGQICVKLMKTIFTFLFIPLIMYILVISLNTIAKVLFNGTTGGGEFVGLGKYMALSFADGAKIGDYNLFELDIDYTSTTQMWQYVNLEDYDYFFSWVAGIAVLLSMTKVLFIFVDRMFSIIILYIISPLPLSASIMDEGQHFKQWREQLLGKFCVGYGAILGLNIFGIVISNLVTADITFFSNSFINFVFKCVIIIGSVFGLNGIVAMIGNLVSQGAGDAALQNAEGMRKGVMSAGKAVGSAVGKIGKKIGGKIAKALGINPKALKAALKQATGLGGDDEEGGGGGGAGDLGGIADALGLGGGEGGNKNPIMDALGSAFSAVKDKVSGAFNTVKEGVKGAYNDIKDKLSRAFKTDFNSELSGKGKMGSDNVVQTPGQNGGFKLSLKGGKGGFK